MGAAIVIACMAVPAYAQTNPGDAVTRAREQLERDKAAKARAEEAVKAAAKATELARIRVTQAERDRENAQAGADSYWGLAGLFKSVRDTLSNATSDEATAKADLEAADAAEAQARADLDQARAAVTQSQQQLRQAEEDARQAAEQADQDTRDAAAQRARDEGRWYPTRQEWWRSDPDHAPSYHERGDWREGGRTYQMHWDPDTGEVYVVDTSDADGAVEVLGVVPTNEELSAILDVAGKDPDLDWARQQVAAAQADPGGAEARIEEYRQRRAAQIEAERQARRDRFRVVKLSDLPTTTPEQRAKGDERDLTGVDWKRLGDLTVGAQQDGVDLDDNAALREYGRQHGLKGKDLDEFVYLFSSPIKWTEGSEAVTNGRHRLAELLDAGVEEVLVAVDEDESNDTGNGKEGEPAAEDSSPPGDLEEPKASLLDAAGGEDEQRIGVGVATGAIGIAPEILGAGAGDQEHADDEGSGRNEEDTALDPNQESPLNPDGVALPETASRGGGGKLNIEALCRQEPDLCLVLDPPMKDLDPPILDIDKQPGGPGLDLDPPMGNDTPGPELDPPQGKDTPELDEPDVMRPGGRLCIEHPEECLDTPGINTPNINMAQANEPGKQAARAETGLREVGPDEIVITSGGLDTHAGDFKPSLVGIQGPPTDDGFTVTAPAAAQKAPETVLAEQFSAASAFPGSQTGGLTFAPVGGSLFALPTMGTSSSSSSAGATDFFGGGGGSQARLEDLFVGGGDGSRGGEVVGGGTWIGDPLPSEAEPAASPAPAEVVQPVPDDCIGTAGGPC